MGCSDWIAIADVLITAILTAIIIFQTHKLNKMQLNFENKANQRELELQKRQIQIDTFPYKREIYTNTFAIFECCNYLNTLSEKIDLYSRTGKELSKIFSFTRDKFVPDTKAILWNLREAEYILPENISVSILKIRTCFDSICSDFISLETIEAVLEDTHSQELFPETKRKILDSVFADCEKILSYVGFIESALPRELRIAGLNR